MEILFFIFIFIIIGLTTFVFIPKNKQKKKEKQKEVIEKTIEEEYDKKCMFVFIKCREKSISSFNTPEELEILKIIAGSYDITDIEEAKKCYNKGKSLVEDEEIHKENQIMDEMRKKEQIEFEENEKRAKIIGKEKYIPSLEKDYREALKKMKESNESKENKPLEEYDNLEEDNQIGKVYSTVEAYNLAIRLKKEKIDEFNKKICDESNIDEKFKYLKFSNIKLLVLKSKNIRISGFVKIDEDMELLGADALLDGTIKITIIDSNGKEIGYGYYSTGTFKDGFLIDSGFTKNEKRFSTICIINDYKEIKEDSEFTYKIEPVNMWLIEC